MKLLINPFERIAGWQALFIGIAAMALTAVIGKINNVAFSGILYANTSAAFGFSATFAMQAVNFFVLFLMMWLAGICFSKTKPRAIDIAGTMALSFSPMLLMTIICFLPVVPASPYDIPRLIVFGIICIPFFVWMIALMYNAYSVSCNLKGSRAVLSFTGALAIAHIVSLLISFLLLSSLFANVPITDVFKSGSTESVVVADSLTIRQKTENVVKAFEQGDFNAVTVYFDENMKKALPPSGLRMGWTQATMAYGKLEKADLDNLKETLGDNYDVIEVPFFFEKERLKLRLVFNKDGTIGGLFIQPAD